jgi:thioredoxin reductase (NADPH)
MQTADGPVDCVVVGGGPAGLIAAYYLCRFRRTVACFDDGDSRALRIPLSRNFPGFPDGIGGSDLLHRLVHQLDNAGGHVIAGRVSSLDARDGGFTVHVGSHSVMARTVLLATGTHDVEPDVEGIAAIRERGLLRQCPVCDGFESSGKRIAVIGKGVHGVREAEFLRTYSTEVTLVDVTAWPRRVDFRPTGILVELADGLQLECDVVYAALGSIPKSSLAAGMGAELDGNGNIVVDEHCRTSITGLYAAGDVVVGLDQLAVAAGHAAIAATAIHNDLRQAAKEARERKVMEQAVGDPAISEAEDQLLSKKWSG